MCDCSARRHSCKGATGHRTHAQSVEIKTMIKQISPAVELSPDLANLAYEMGLNPSKFCENALKQAIGRLQGLNQNGQMMDGASFTPSFRPPICSILLK